VAKDLGIPKYPCREAGLPPWAADLNRRTVRAYGPETVSLSRPGARLRRHRTNG